VLVLAYVFFSGSSITTAKQEIGLLETDVAVGNRVSAKQAWRMGGIENIFFACEREKSS
jgi:hypothetical protein